MKPTRLFVLILMMALMAVPLFAKPRHPAPPTFYRQTASRQTQELASKSLRAWRGLSRAAAHSPAIEAAAAEKGSPDKAGPAPEKRVGK